MAASSVNSACFLISTPVCHRSVTFMGEQKNQNKIFKGKVPSVNSCWLLLGQRNNSGMQLGTHLPVMTYTRLVTGTTLTRNHEIPGKRLMRLLELFNLVSWLTHLVQFHPDYIQVSSPPLHDVKNTSGLSLGISSSSAFTMPVSFLILPKTCRSQSGFLFGAIIRTNWPAIQICLFV